jgi:DNA anti-recombination protein RmuC
MADEDSTDREDSTDADLEVAAAIAADMAGSPVAPIDPERIELIVAMRDAELAELMAERWFADQERIEQQHRDAEAEAARARWAAVQRQREEAERRAAREAAQASHAAAASARATQQRLARLEAQERQAAHLRAVQQTLQNFAALRPEPEEVLEFEVENVLHPSFARRRWGTD